MIRKFIFLFLSFLALTTVRAQTPTETTARVVKAEIYRNAARLYQQAEVPVGTGNQTVIIHGLSASAIRESLILKGTGPADILHISYQKNYLVTPKDREQIERLKAQIKDLEDKLARLEARSEALKTEMKLLADNMKLEKNTNVNTLQQYAAYYRKRVEEIHLQMHQLENQTKPLKEKLDKLRKQLRQWEDKSRRATQDLIVTLQVHKPATLHFDFNYVTKQASWQPVYHIRSNGTGQPLQWEYKAEVRQQTGLDWDNIPLTLSTYKPLYRMQLPKPKPWYLHPAPPVRAAAPARYKVQGIVAEAAAEEKDEALAYREAGETEQTLEVEYALPGLYSVPSGRHATLVHIKSFETPADYQYYAVPYINPAAFLRATVQDIDRYRLVPGQARIYFEGQYTGKTYIDATEPHSRLELALGIDPQIKIERKEDEKYSEYNLTGGKVTVRKAYVITIYNGKSVPVDIEVKDRVPVSQDEKIKVKRVDTDGQVDKKGIVTWHKTIAPGKKVQLHLRFEVQYPKNMRLWGL